MSLMLKSLSIISILISSVFATAQIDEKAIAFEQKKFSSNEKVTIKAIEIAVKKEFDAGWYGYVFDVSAQVNGKNVKAKDVMFTNGSLVSTDLMDIAGKSFQDLMKPKLSEKYYNPKHLIAGNADAKHKIVVFSDPLCPFCIEYVPELIKDVKNNPQKFALYYYHFPLLRLHPDANIIVKAMHIASLQGVEDVTLKTYTGEFYKYLKKRKNPDQAVLNVFNKIIGTKITMEQIKDPMVSKAIGYDVFMGEEAMVQGTPTVFVDGVYDKSRYKYDRLK